MTQTNPPPLSAELLIATGCAHCPVVLEGLTGLIKEGVIAHLTVSNIVADPGRARELGVRSVPWLQLGPFTLQGLHSPAELREWAERAGSMEGMGVYLAEQLKQGKLAEMEKLLADQPQWLPAIIPLLEDPQTDIQVRIGIDAILESLAESVDMSALVPELGRLSASDNASIRADTSHYLALIGGEAAIPYLRARLQDEDEDVREAAREALEEMGQTP